MTPTDHALSALQSEMDARSQAKALYGADWRAALERMWAERDREIKARRASHAKRAHLQRELVIISAGLIALGHRGV